MKKTILRASSIVTRGEQNFLKTPLSVIGNMVDLSLIAQEYSFVSEECWLGGGTLIRLLSGQGKMGDERSYDRDYFFPTRQAMEIVFEKMIQKHYTIKSFNFFKRKLIRRASITADDLDLPSDVPINIIKNSKVQEILHRQDLVTVELLSPKGIRYQLIAGYTGKDPVEIINKSDFTICQLAIDREYIYSGTKTWNDLSARRLQHTGTRIQIFTSWRVFKFMKMGYRPTPQTLLIALKSLILAPFLICR
jgi:hypothetical protein